MCPGSRVLLEAAQGPEWEPPLARDVKDLADLRVQLREQHLYYQDQLLPVSRIIVHPQFYAVQIGADIALLELEEPVNVSSHVHTVTLPPASETFPPGTPCWVTGWGDVDNDGGSGDSGRLGQVGTRSQSRASPWGDGSLGAAQGGDSGGQDEWSGRWREAAGALSRDGEASRPGRPPTAGLGQVPWHLRASVSPSLKGCIESSYVADLPCGEGNHKGGLAGRRETGAGMRPSCPRSLCHGQLRGLGLEVVAGAVGPGRSSL